MNYDPIPTTTYDEDFPSVSAGPSYDSYGGGEPRIRGVSHTVKHVNVYDSHPHIGGGGGGGGGYEVVEPGEEEEDTYTTVNGHQQFPATYNFIRGAAEPAPHDPFAGLPAAPSLQPGYDPFGASPTVPQASHDPFAASPQPTSFSGGESFTGAINTHDPFAPSAPTASQEPTTFAAGTPQELAPTSFIGADGGDAFLSDENIEDKPVHFSREAGIQQVITTGGHESVVY